MFLKAFFALKIIERQNKDFLKSKNPNCKNWDFAFHLFGLEIQQKRCLSNICYCFGSSFFSSGGFNAASKAFFAAII